MKVKYLTDTGIDTVKVNIETFQKLMTENKTDNSWIKNFMGVKMFANSNIDLEYKFLIDEENPEKTDYENAVGIYELFTNNNIGNAVICDEKFIAGFILQFGYEYFIKRWGTETLSHIKAMLFFDDGQRRAMCRNAVGRLYKRVKLTIDNSNENDKYWLTKFAFENNNTFRIEYYPIFDSPSVSLPYFKALKRWVDSGHKISDIDSIVRHYTVLCNVNIVEEMDEEDIIEYLIEYLEQKNKKVFFEL